VGCPYLYHYCHMTGHSLIIGASRTGKSTLAKILGRKAIEIPRKVLVCDQFASPDWRQMGAELYTDPTRYLDAVQAPENRSSFLVCDEAGTAATADKRLTILTTTARHFGHTSIIIAHKHTQLPTVLRGNCDRLILFATDQKTFDGICEEFASVHDEQIPRVKRWGNFVVIERFGKLRVGQIQPDNTVRWLKAA
jgi:ABC-type transporter Mla maintaining outer membrane lipid asymmetry ATPase subunit MlaF